MKRTVIYWITNDKKRKAEVKQALGITCVSVNGESDYKGDPSRLVPFVEEGLISIRMKDYEQEIRRKEVCFDSIESESFNRKKVRRSSRARKV